MEGADALEEKEIVTDIEVKRGGKVIKTKKGKKKVIGASLTLTKEVADTRRTWSNRHPDKQANTRLPVWTRVDGF